MELPSSGSKSKPSKKPTIRIWKVEPSVCLFPSFFLSLHFDPEDEEETVSVRVSNSN
jgi:hypothetical protein